MSRSLKEALENRRIYYQITKSSPIPDQQIREILEFGIRNVPSAFNSQSTRVVLLLRDSHKKLWAKTKSILKGIVPPDAFVKTAAKIDKSFASGYGTVLFLRIWLLSTNYKRLFRPTRKNFLFGHNRLPPCTNWSFGACWKKRVLEFHYSIIIP